MGDFVLDLDTKVVNPGQQMWAVFPGKNRRFFGQFAADRVVFLETPSLKLTPKVLEDDNLLRQHVAMSQAILNFQIGRTKNPPSRRPGNYPVIKTASFNAAVGNVRNVYERMKPGDLVLVGSSSYWAPILVGEVVGPFDPGLTVVNPAYGNEPIPARRVRWLKARQERRFLSQNLAQLLSNRKAVIGIDKQVYGEEVFKFAYGAYVFGTDSRYVFSGPEYNNIATSTIPGLQLITYFAAAFHAAELNELNKFSTLSIDDAINNYFEQDILHSFEIDFSSPGEYILYAKRAALPLCVAALVAATAGTMNFTDARTAEVTNSVSMAVPQPGKGDGGVCDEIEINEKYKQIMNSINADKYNEWCKLNKAARDGVGLKVDIKIKQKNN